MHTHACKAEFLKFLTDSANEPVASRRWGTDSVNGLEHSPRLYVYLSLSVVTLISAFVPLELYFHTPNLPRTSCRVVQLVFLFMYNISRV
jgi:hypothetical protein